MLCISSISGKEMYFFKTSSWVTAVTISLIGLTLWIVLFLDEHYAPRQIGSLRTQKIVRKAKSTMFETFHSNFIIIEFLIYIIFTFVAGSTELSITWACTKGVNKDIDSLVKFFVNSKCLTNGAVCHTRVWMFGKISPPQVEDRISKALEKHTAVYFASHIISIFHLVYHYNICT